MSNCIICGQESDKNLVVIIRKKNFEVCSYDCGIKLLQQQFRQGKIGLLREIKTPLTIRLIEIEEE